MRWLRAAAFEEYVRWYLTRERRKGRAGVDLSTASWGAIVAEMRGTHPDKLRSWFERAEWSVVLLDVPEDVFSLVCVDGPETRRNRLVIGNELNNRLARVVIEAARTHRYFDDEEVRRTNSVEAHFRQERRDAFLERWPRFEGDERLVLCSLNADEQRENPGGSYYLHDGFGRVLPWLYSIVHDDRRYQAVEAFLAEERW